MPSASFDSVFQRLPPRKDALVKHRRGTDVAPLLVIALPLGFGPRQPVEAGWLATGAREDESDERVGCLR